MESGCAEVTELVRGPTPSSSLSGTLHIHTRGLPPQERQSDTGQGLPTTPLRSWDLWAEDGLLTLTSQGCQVQCLARCKYPTDDSSCYCDTLEATHQRAVTHSQVTSAKEHGMR